MAAAKRHVTAAWLWNEARSKVSAIAALEKSRSGQGSKASRAANGNDNDASSLAKTPADPCVSPRNPPQDASVLDTTPPSKAFMATLRRDLSTAAPPAIGLPDNAKPLDRPHQSPLEPVCAGGAPHGGAQSQLKSQLEEPESALAVNHATGAPRQPALGNTESTLPSLSQVWRQRRDAMQSCLDKDVDRSRGQVGSRGSGLER